MTANTNGKHIMPSIGEDLSKYDLSKDFQWTCPICAEVIEEHRECDKEGDCEKCDEHNDHAEFGCCRCACCGGEVEWKKLHYQENQYGYVCNSKECKDDSDEDD
jgi:hypothetical protein